MAASPGSVTASVVSLNLAVVRDDASYLARLKPGEQPPRTGIDKRPVSGAVRLERLGVAGDTVCDTKNHGGVDQAVYAYAVEDIQWWQRELDGQLAVTLAPGSVGENLTTAGVELAAAVIGERWRVGGAMLEVSTPRIPCRTFAGFWGVDKLIKIFTAAGRPGAYLRVLAEGDVSAGDEISVVSRPEHGLTIGEAFRALTGDRSLVPKLLTAPQLPEEAQRKARSWLAGVE